MTNQVVRAGQQLLWVPLFLAAFAKEGYGEWLTLFGLAGYVAMSDLGVQIYWLNLLAGAHVRGEIESYRRIFRAGLFMFLFVGGLALVVSAAFSLLRGPSRTLDLETIGSSTASIVFVVLVASTLLSVFSRMVRGVFRTVGQNPKAVWFEVTRESLTFALVAGALLLGLGPLGLSWVYGGIAILMVVWVVLTVRGRFAELVDFRVHKADHKTVGGLVGGGSIHLAGVLANLLLVQGTLIITNWALGAAAVALVATSRTLANLVRQVSGSVYTSSVPEFSRLEAASNSADMKKLLRRGTSAVLTMSGIACIFLTGLGPWLFDIWTGGRFPDAAPLIYLFAGSVLVDVQRMSFHSFLTGCNRIAVVSLANISYAITSLASMSLLFPTMGALAVPVATMVCGAFIHLPIVLWGSTKILGRHFVVSCTLKTGAGVLLAGIMAVPLVYLNFSDTGFFFLLICSLAGAAVFGAVAVLLLFDRADVVAARSRIGRFFRGGKGKNLLR